MTGHRVPGSVQATPIDWAQLDDDPAPRVRADVAAIDVELPRGVVLDIGDDRDAVAFIVAGSVVHRLEGGDRTLRAGDSAFMRRGECRVSCESGSDVAVARLVVVRGV